MKKWLKGHHSLQYELRSDPLQTIQSITNNSKLYQKEMKSFFIERKNEKIYFNKT